MWIWPQRPQICGPMDQGRGEEWSRKDHSLRKMRKCWRKSLDKITVNRNDVHFWTAVLPNLCYPPNKFPKCYRNQTKTAGNGCFVLFRRESAKNRLKSLWYRLLFQGISPTIHGNVRHLKGHWKRQFFSFMEFFIHGMKPCHARFTIFLVCIAWMQTWRPNRWMTQDGSKRSVDIQGESFTSITGKERLGNLTFSFKSRNKPIHNNRLIKSTARFWPAKGQAWDRRFHRLYWKECIKKKSMKTDQEKTTWLKDDQWKSDEWELHLFFQGERRDCDIGARWSLR